MGHLCHLTGIICRCRLCGIICERDPFDCFVQATVKRQSANCEFLLKFAWRCHDSTAVRRAREWWDVISVSTEYAWIFDCLNCSAYTFFNGIEHNPVDWFHNRQIFSMAMARYILVNVDGECMRIICNCNTIVNYIFMKWNCSRIAEKKQEAIATFNFNYIAPCYLMYNTDVMNFYDHCKACSEYSIAYEREPIKWTTIKFSFRMGWIYLINSGIQKPCSRWNFCTLEFAQ